MNKTPNVKMTSVKLAEDVHQALAAWATENLSSMCAELNRSVRERAQREQADRAGRR